MMASRLWPAILLASLAPAPAAVAAADLPNYDRRWAWAMANLLVPAEADRVVGLIERAGRAGYNGLVVSDHKLNLLGRMPPAYFEHVARVKAAADRAGIELIPAVFPIGYSSGLLAHDPNLAEGMPAEATFVVRGRDATLAPDPAARVVNGDLEATRGAAFAGFTYQDAPGLATVVDREVRRGGASSCRMEGFAATPTCRLIQPVRLRPHACYVLSCWVRTRDLAPTGAFRLLALGKSGGRPLTHHEAHLKATQDWTRVEVAFNTQDEAEVNLYVGVWGARAGTLWVDDFAVEEVGLVNPLRRAGCPLTVASADGATAYVEGRDFEPVVDPLLGMVPFAGEYAFDHPPAPLRLTTDSRIRDGERLRVGWYHPALAVGATACCLSDPKVDELLADQARRVNDLFAPRTFFMQHDELRVANWCRACRDRGLTPGRLLADNARRCREILRAVNPAARVATWSDMFDPHHNAVADYYLVNGTLAGSWEGLDPGVIVVNWNASKARLSLDFFAGRGHPQVIAGYYDADDNLQTWDAAAAGVPRLLGFMYTTWENRYGDLERYGRALTRRD